MKTVIIITLLDSTILGPYLGKVLWKSVEILKSEYGLNSGLYILF